MVTARKKKRYFYHAIKRVLDIIISIIGILFLALMLPIVALFIKLEDGGTIFLKNKRIGKNGKEFTMIKFRSMCMYAEDKLEEILANDKKLAKEYKEHKKLENDPRVTKVGNFLRKTSLDEFPQFINVLIGDMSIVGNRPYLPREKKDMGKSFKKIVSVKGGVFSYWAVMGRNDISFEERLKLEEYYADHESLFLDIKILFKTVFVVFSRKGAK